MNDSLKEKKQFWKNVRHLQSFHDILNKELAYEIGYSTHGFECAKYHNKLTVEMAIKISKFLNESLDDLFYKDFSKHY